MTLSEKVQQLHTNNAPAIPRLGVQQYTYGSEGQPGHPIERGRPGGLVRAI
jgi:beta-glucosidase